MADPFNGAESSVDAQKRALLAAIAQQGSAAKAQYAAEADAATNTRTEAVATAGERAGAIGAPADAARQLAAMGSKVADTYAADAYRGAFAVHQENERRGAANADYMDQVKAAVPIARSVAAARIAEIQAAERDRAASRGYAAEDQAWQREQRQWEREDRMSEIAAKPKFRTVSEATQQLGWSNPRYAETITSDPDFAEDLSYGQELLSDGGDPNALRAEISAAYGANSYNGALLLTMLGLDTLNPAGYYSDESSPPTVPVRRI